MPDLPVPVNPRIFEQNLLRWFEHNRRPLPWRGQDDCYKILLSEFLLQQTQVEQGLPYYYKFLEHFPDVETLAQAGEEEVLQLWTGLGYYARARNLLKCARQLTTRFNGVFPDTLKEALALPGIGPYTAAAILSLCYNLPYAAIDGNVLRVIARIFAIESDTRLASTHKQIKEIAGQLISQKHPGAFNEALMELGALVCTPKNPLCAQCPLNAYCRAYQLGRTDELPFRSKAAVKKKQLQYVLVLKNEGKFLIARRPAKGLLASMWELPNITVKRLSRDKKKIAENLKAVLPVRHQLMDTGRPLRHIYSHIQLDYLPLLIELYSSRIPLAQHEARRWLTAEELKHFSLHGAHQKILNDAATQSWFNN